MTAYKSRATFKTRAAAHPRGPDRRPGGREERKEKESGGVIVRVVTRHGCGSRTDEANIDRHNLVERSINHQRVASSPAGVEESMRALGLAALLLVSLLGFWGATEYVAAELRYAPELGPPWVALGGVHVYPPWAWVEWGRRYQARAPTRLSQRRGAHDARRRNRDGDRRAGCPAAQAVGRKPRPRQLAVGHDLGDAGRGPLARPRAWCSARPATPSFAPRSTGRAGPASPRRATAPSCATTAQSTSSASHRPAAARAWAWSSRRCSPGRTRCSSTTSRRRTGR